MKSMKLLPIITLIVLMLVLVGGCRKSYSPGDWDVKPDLPTPPDQEYKGPTKSLKIMSINMNRLTSFEETVKIIEEYNPDFLFLRQVDSATTRAEKVDRPGVIAQRLGMESFFVKNFDYQTGGFGNAVLSKFPILETKAKILSREEGNTAELRSLASLRAKIDDKNEIYFTGTELDPAANNRNLQVIDILNETAKFQIPQLLVGNFNEQEGGVVINYIKDVFAFGCLGTGCPTNSGGKVYDYITYKAVDEFILDKYAAYPKSQSTFLPMVAELRLKLKQ